MSLDATALLDANSKPIEQNQERHTTQLNALNKVMASLADYYQVGKLNNDPALIASLQKDFKESWIIGSDRFTYDPNSLEATITSYVGSTVTEPFERKVLVPEYGGETLTNVLGNSLGLTYFQILFNTEDDANEIKKTLYQLSGKHSDETKVWTPNQNERRSVPNRAAVLIFDLGVFHIVGDYDLNLDGRSRGVLESPAGTALNTKYVTPVPSVNVSPELRKGIDKKNECVYLSNIQDVDDYSKYVGVFYFHNNRFVYSMTSLKIDDDSLDTRISTVLALPQSTKEKLGILETELHPVYARLRKYEKHEKGFSLVDDAESFAEPLVKS